MFDASRHKNVERTARVAKASENSRAEVEHHEERHSEEIDSEVEYGQWQHVGWSAHKREDRFCHSHTYKHKQQSAHHSHHSGCGDSLLDFFVIVLSYMVGYNDIGSHGNSKKKVDDKTYHRGVASHCGKSLAACEMSHHRHVDRVEQLLQHAARRQGQSEQQYFHEQWSMKHVYFIGFCHVSPLFISLARKYLLLHLCDSPVIFLLPQRQRTRRPRW